MKGACRTCDGPLFGRTCLCCSTAAWRRSGLTGAQRLAIECAAAGLVSGRLSEWPALRSAFAALGLPYQPSLGLAEMVAHAREAQRRLRLEAA